MSNKEPAFILPVLFLLIALCNISQAMNGKRSFIDLTEDENISVSSPKKQQLEQNYTLPKDEIFSLPIDSIKTLSINLAKKMIAQNFKDKEKIKKPIQKMSQSSFNPIVSIDLRHNDDIFTDPVFLNSIKKIEENYNKKQEKESFQNHQTSRTTSIVSLPSAIPSHSTDAFLLDPVFLKSVDEIEQKYQSQKKTSFSPKAPIEAVYTKLLNTFENHQDHLMTSIKCVFR